jgi:hypothetical protein
MRVLLRTIRATRKGVRFQHNGPRPVPEVAPKVTPIDIPTVFWYHRLGPVTNFFGWFHRTQTKRPYTVQLGTSVAIYLFGDLAAQEVGGEQYDGYRTLRMMTIGALGSIPGYRW